MKVFTEREKIEILVLYQNLNYDINEAAKQSGVTALTLKKWIDSDIGDRVLTPSKVESTKVSNMIRYSKNKAELRMNEFYEKANGVRQRIVDKIDDLIPLCEKPNTIPYLVDALKVIDDISNRDKAVNIKNSNTWVTNIIQKINNQISYEDNKAQ